MTGVGAEDVVVETDSVLFAVVADDVVGLLVPLSTSSSTVVDDSDDDVSEAENSSPEKLASTAERTAAAAVVVGSQTASPSSKFDQAAAGCRAQNRSKATSSSRRALTVLRDRSMLVREDV